MAQLAFISDKNRERYLRIIGPIARILGRVGVHPNILSITGLLLGVLAGLFYSQGAFFWAAWIVVLSGICDTLDGQIARQNNKHSTFGAFFDSTLDRYGEMFFFIGLAYYFAGGQSFATVAADPVKGVPCPWTVVLILLTIAGSFMVSYTRARAEGLGVECRGGVMQRPERITLLVIGTLLGSIPVAGPVFIKLTLLLLAISTNGTAIYRIVAAKNRFKRENPVP
jgi:CDP-diacylglycerol--glycerol-3-phosphate 3-phosphatidyltransferase